MKAWENPYNFAHEYCAWMNFQSSKVILGCECNKYTLDVIDENMLKCAGSKNSLAFRLAMEL